MSCFEVNQVIEHILHLQTLLHNIGCMHNDLHGTQIIIDARTKFPKIIDFKQLTCNLTQGNNWKLNKHLSISQFLSGLNYKNQISENDDIQQCIRAQKDMLALISI